MRHRDENEHLDVDQDLDTLCSFSPPKDGETDTETNAQTKRGGSPSVQHSKVYSRDKASHLALAAPAEAPALWGWDLLPDLA